MTRREKNVRARNRALAAGLCTTCQVAPQRPNRRSCAKCVRQIVAKADDYRKKRIAAGLCYNCGNGPHLPDRRLCLTCKTAANAATRRFQARIKAKAQAEGLCNGCGKRAAPPGRKRCDPCVDGTRVSRYAKYGLTHEQLRELGDECHICGSRRRLAIDHDHTHLNIRGLLCHTCNAGLGMFGDAPDRLSKAIQYLMATTSRGVAAQIDQPGTDPEATPVTKPGYLH